MDQDLTEIVVVADRSGSMAKLATDTIGGFNTFLDEQKKLPGKALLTYVQFDTEYEVVHNGRYIRDVPALTAETYVPRGMTALLDAVGKTIAEVGVRLSKTPEELRPSKLIMVIITDGLENSSKEYELAQVKKMIEHQQTKYRWEFCYLGANQDAFLVGAGMGIAAMDSHNYVHDSYGVRSSYSVASSRVTRARSSK